MFPLVQFSTIDSEMQSGFLYISVTFCTNRLRKIGQKNERGSVRGPDRARKRCRWEDAGMRFGSSVGYDRYPAELPKIREKKGGNWIREKREIRKSSGRTSAAFEANASTAGETPCGARFVGLLT